MNDVVNIAEEIKLKIEILKNCRSQLAQKGNAKAQKMAEYEKAIAVIMIRLKNGIEYELDGNKIINPQTTIIEKLARGIAWKEKLEQDKAETDYKSLITFIQTVEAEVNALQSINRYLDKE